MIPDKSESPEFSAGSTDPATDGLVLVLTTWPADTPLDTLAASTVRDGLAACVSVLPLQRSTYRWQGDVEVADEHQVLIKTTRDRVQALEAAIHAAHPYDVPEWLVLPVSEASDAYGAWIRRSCDASPAAPTARAGHAPDRP